jgi:spore maturation protein A
MLNAIWLGLVLVSVVYAAFTGTMPAVTEAAFKSAESAVSLVIKLSGFMIFMLGVMRVASDAGLLAAFARGSRRSCAGCSRGPARSPRDGRDGDEHGVEHARPRQRRDAVRAQGDGGAEPAESHPGVATDAMVLFLVINATALHLMAPTGTMAVRAAAGSASPGAIWVPTLIATDVRDGAGWRWSPAARARALCGAPLAGAERAPRRDTRRPDRTPAAAAAPARARRAARSRSRSARAARRDRVADRRSLAGVPWPAAPARRRARRSPKLADPAARRGAAARRAARRRAIYDSMVAGAREGSTSWCGSCPISW